MPEVRVNGEVLKWARKLRGLTEDDAAALLDITPEGLREYEASKKRPLVGLLRLMSARYRINFTTLLMPQPLPGSRAPEDHRSRNRNPLSIDTLIAIEDVNEALNAFSDIAAESALVVPRLNIGSAKLTDDPEEVAARERRRVGVSIEEQQSWRGLADARRKWRRRLEDMGVFTYMFSMPPNELSGFSIFGDGVAAVCVNDRESSEGAKIFTLIHEYCHLLLRRTGVSDENDKNRVEKFCNEFAASFLIPRTALGKEVAQTRTPHEFSDAEVKRLAARFRVSNRAVALRLERTGLATAGFYSRRTAPWDVPAPAPQIPEDKLITYPTQLLKRVGRLHALTVLRAERKRLINSFDASELLGLKPAHFHKLASRIA